LEIAGSPGSEADKLTTYEELTATRDIAAKALSLAVAHRDQARQDAESQHLFIQVISRPNLARDYARYPLAALDLVALLVISLIVFHVLREAGEQAWCGSERVEPRLPQHRSQR
jgi:capsular polysaccharide transport system permease protein